ncbi:MAG: type II secretion system secretin GspD [Candidatus Hydrogenedentes bacterium]|nr:type II secretion system secretin GspD [Candidatus Hydrogenedentota bacterium]
MNTPLAPADPILRTMPLPHAGRVIARAAMFGIVILVSCLFVAPAQQGNGRSVFAAEGEVKESKEEKAAAREQRKEGKKEQRSTQKKQVGVEGPEPMPEMPEATEEKGADEPAPLVDAEEVEGTAPPRPRVNIPSRPAAPLAATEMPLPESKPSEGVLQEPPPPPELKPNEARPKLGAPGGSPLYLDFDKQSLAQVVAAIGPMIGKNFLLDQTVAEQPVTLITHDAIPSDMILPIFEAVLNTYNFKMVETAGGNLIKIVPLEQNKDQADLILEQNVIPEGYENYIFQVVQIKHAAASEVSQLLTEVGSKEAKVTVYERTNMLLLYGTSSSIRKMLELIEQVDAPGFEEVVEFFTLEFTRAEIIAEQITTVLLGDEAQAGASGQQPAQPVVRQPTPVARPSRPGTPGGTAATQLVIGTQALTLRITPDERLNALIVVASQPLMERVRDLIEKLDTPTPPDSNNMHVRELQHADAEAVQETLQQLIGGGGGSSSPRSSAGAGGTGARPGAAGGGGGGASAVSAAGGAADGDVQLFEKSVNIAMYEKTNSLLIVASPQDFKLLDSIISQIDLPMRQVHVEAIIMEVAIGDRFKLAVESAGLTANDYFALNNIVSLANVLQSGPLAALDTDDITSIGIIDGTTELTFPDGAGGTVTQEVPNVPLLLQALESLTALDVISRPSLITVDNEEANIVDGQDVPIPTGSQRSLDSGGGVGGSVFTTTQREEIGVKLTVTPQISQGNYVYLDLEVEVSRPIQSSVGIDPNDTGITLSLSKVVNKVVVRDGSTGILGGLISEGTDRLRQQTPLLGDLPLLGWLFGRKDYQRTKRNLVVLITPTIVKEGIDLERLTDAQTAKAATANADVFFERGIFKKIPTKARMRSKYRPTEAALDEVRGISDAPAANVERGTIEGAQ